MVSRRLKHYSEIESVPLQGETCAVGETRKLAVAYLHTVGGIQSTIPVGIGIKEIPEFRTLVCGKIVRIAVYKRLYIIKVGLMRGLCGQR